MTDLDAKRKEFWSLLLRVQKSHNRADWDTPLIVAYWLYSDDIRKAMPELILALDDRLAGMAHRVFRRYIGGGTPREELEIIRRALEAPSIYDYIDDWWVIERALVACGEPLREIVERAAKSDLPRIANVAREALLTYWVHYEPPRDTMGYPDDLKKWITAWMNDRRKEVSRRGARLALWADYQLGVREITKKIRQSTSLDNIRFYIALLAAYTDTGDEPPQCMSQIARELLESGEFDGDECGFAIECLRHFRTEQNKALLVTIACSSDRPGTIRAKAIQALSYWTWDCRAEKKFLLSLKDDKNIRVRKTAGLRLRKVMRQDRVNSNQ